MKNLTTHTFFHNSQHWSTWPRSLFSASAPIGATTHLEWAGDDLLAAESYVQNKRKAVLKRQLNQRRTEKVYEIDLLELPTRSSAPYIIDYAPTFDWKCKPPTEKQLLAPRRNRIDLALARASVILSNLFVYSERERASRKQKFIVTNWGHPNPWRLTKREANRWNAQHKEQLKKSLLTYD